MHWPPRRAERYSASSSWLRHSPARTIARCGPASCEFLQRGRSTHWSRELSAILRSWLWSVAGGKAVQHLAEAFPGQILVGILPDQHHRRVHAGAKTLNFFPAEIPVLGQMKGFVVDSAVAHLDDIIGAAQPARRGATDLNVGLLADRLQLKHRVEGRDFQHADVGHAEQIGDGADCGFRNPAIMLFLDAPQDGDRRRRLAARRIFRDLLLRPGESFRRERKARGLLFLRCEAADGHVVQSLIACGTRPVVRSNWMGGIAITGRPPRTRYRASREWPKCRPAGGPCRSNPSPADAQSRARGSCICRACWSRRRPDRRRTRPSAPRPRRRLRRAAHGSPRCKA